MKIAIVPIFQLLCALQLLLIASKTALDKHAEEKNLAAFIFDPQDEVLKLNTHCINEAEINTSIEAVMDGFDEPLWLEIDALFLERALRNYRKCSHIKFEIDSPCGQINVVGGHLHEADMISEDAYFSRNNAHLELQPNTKTLNTLSSYDFQAPSPETSSISLTHKDRKLFKLVSNFNKSQFFNENDAITLEVQSNKLVLYSTNFFVELASEVSTPKFSATFGGAGFDIAQRIINSIQISPGLNIKLNTSGEALSVSTIQSSANLPTKLLCDRPALRPMPKFKQTDGIAIDVRRSLKALKEVNSLQKKNEDVVRVFVKNDEEKSLAFEVNSNKGHLASQMRWDSTHLDGEFEVSVMRGPIIAALMLFSDDATVYFFGHENDSEYFFITNEPRNKYVSFEKVT